MRHLLPRLLLPLIGLLLIEATARFGLWDRWLPPASHAGHTVRMRAAVDAHPDPIDIVTIGSSRAEYGFDHAAVAAAARTHGLVHANLSMPGSHWMTMVEQSRWIQAHRPEVRGVVIALSAPDMLWAHNGSYELGIVQPIRDPLAISDTVRTQFVPGDLTTYGVYSALFGYRQAVQYAATTPRKWWEELVWFREYGKLPLFDGPHPQSDLCGLPIATVAECAAATPGVPEQQVPIDQCRGLLPAVGRNPDWSGLTDDTLPDERRQLRDGFQAQIRAMGWQQPPVIVLMPITHLWRKDLSPAGMQAWAHLVLDPLAERGEIVLIDLSTEFDENGSTRCDYFVDLYHQNDRGAKALTERILPRFEQALYAPLTR
jgi:hypothetical protein